MRPTTPDAGSFHLSLADCSPVPVTLPTGITLNYVRKGSGPTMILIHGAMGDLLAWSPQWGPFTQKFDCISYSRRYSHPNPNPMKTRSHSALVDAEDLEGLMDTLGIDNAILVGSSYGGFTALAAALRMPSRIDAVVSVEAPMMRYGEADPRGADIIRRFKETTADPARAAFERGDDEKGALILTGGIVGRDPATVPQHIMARRMRNIEAAKSLALSDDEFPQLGRDELAALPMPVLLMSGAKTAPVHAAIFAAVCAAMPNATSVIVEDSGHSVSQQQPEVFNAEVLAFLKSHQLCSALSTA